MSPRLFSSNLQHLAKARKLRQKDIAERMRIKQNRVSAWFCGTCFPRTRELCDLCDVLGYYDVYKMLAVDLKRDGVDIRPEKLPESVRATLEGIQQNVAALLKH